MVKKEVVVIGGGPGGYAAALYCAKSGHAVSLVEKAEMGGTCLNRGCIPTKAFLHAAELTREFSNATAWGFSIPSPLEVNFAKTQKMKNRIVKQLRGGVEYLLKEHDVKILRGNGRLNKNAQVEYRNENGEINKLSADATILATGSHEIELPGFATDGDTILNSTQMLNLQELPQSIIIIGGGVIGVEFASLMLSLGRKVTLVEYMDTLIPSEDADVSGMLHRFLEAFGATVLTETKGTKVLQKQDGISIEVETGGIAKTIQAEKLLVCVGRKANTQEIGLDSANIAVQNGRITTNEQMQTNVSTVYAVGDITASPQLAHVAYHEALIAAKSISETPEPVNYTAVPSCIFSYPEIASVGMAEGEAKELYGTDVEIATQSFAGNGKAIIQQQNEGFVKIIYKKSNHIVLGCSIIGPKATELIPEMAMAVRWGLPIEKIATTIHAHPTLSELLGETAASAIGLGLHCTP